MAGRRSHAEIEELLGAYALDAVDQDEAAEVADHLVDCPRCRAEVAEHREVAALLAHGGEPAPEGLWDRIAGAIEGSAPAQAPPPALFSAAPGPTAQARRRSWSSRAFGPVVAAAAVVIAVLGFQIVDQGNKLAEQDDRIEAIAEGDALSREFQAAMADPDAQMVALTSSDGDKEVRAVVQGTTGYLHAASLPALPEGRTYQLWGGNGESLISLGILGSRPDVISFEMADGVVVLAVTEEPASGVVVSDQPPVVVGEMPTDA